MENGIRKKAIYLLRYRTPHWRVRSIISMCAVAALFLFRVIEIVTSNIRGECIDFYEMNRTHIKSGTYVELDVDAVLDCYAYVEHTENALKTSIDEYYIVWLDDGDVISVSVNDEKTKKKLEELCDYTWECMSSGEEWNPPYVVTIKGEIAPIESEGVEYYVENLDSIGFDEDYGNVIYYNIDGTKAVRKHGFDLIVYIIMEVSFVGLFLVNKRLEKEEKIQEKEKSNIYEKANFNSTMPGFEDTNTYEPINFDKVDFGSVDVDDPFKNQ